jgi:hypothetical protein
MLGKGDADGVGTLLCIVAIGTLRAEDHQYRPAWAGRSAAGALSGAVCRFAACGSTFSLRPVRLKVPPAHAPSSGEPIANLHTPVLAPNRPSSSPPFLRSCVAVEQNSAVARSEGAALQPISAALNTSKAR